MIFGETKERREQREQRWHLWFAWFPVELDNGQIAWLERVERRRHVLREAHTSTHPALSLPAIYSGVSWDYRERGASFREYICGSE